MHSSRTRYLIRPTAWGAFGVAWGDWGILRSWLNARTDDEARSRILRAFPEAIAGEPPTPIAAAAQDVARLLAGDPRPIRSVDLDMRGLPEFDRRVYDVTRTIPPGSTMTYGSIARALGEEPMRAKDVGVALGRNPFAPIVPCHRVVAAGGRLGGYSAPGGAATKRRLLELEGAAIVASPWRPGLFDA